MVTSYRGLPPNRSGDTPPDPYLRGNARWPRPYSASEVWLPLLAPTRDMHGMGQEKFGDRYRAILDTAGVDGSAPEIARLSAGKIPVLLLFLSHRA